jgi:hypothetical protein
MSQDNVETWRASIEDFRACAREGDWEGWLSRVVELWDPAIEWDFSESPLPDLGGVFTGREAVLGFWREWLAAWGTFDFDYELLDAGDRVVMLVDQRTVGRSSGVEVPSVKYAQVATFKDGLMVHWRMYGSQSKALEDAGLPG